jgi:hypothetical protein
MRKVTAILAILMLVTGNICSQTNLVEKAIRKGRSSDFSYEVNCSKNTLLTPDQLKKWADSNSAKYHLLDFSTRKQWFAGSVRELVSAFSFIPENELSEYRKFSSVRSEEMARESRDRSRNEQVDLALLLGVATETSGPSYEIISDTIFQADDYNGVSFSLNDSGNESNTGISENNAVCYTLEKKWQDIYCGSGKKTTFYRIKCSQAEFPDNGVYTIFNVPDKCGNRDAAWYFATPPLGEDRFTNEKTITFEEAAKKICKCR